MSFNEISSRFEDSSQGEEKEMKRRRWHAKKMSRKNKFKGCL